MNNFRSDFKKFFKKFFNFRNILLLFLFLVLSMLWFRYVAGLILIVAFIPVTFFTMRYAKLVPHVTIESNTGMSIFMGYLFGNPLIPLIYGPIVGGVCYAMNSVVTPCSMSTVIIAGISGAIAAVLKIVFGLSFTYAFIASILIRTVIAFPWMLLFTDPVEVTSHQVSQLLSNMILYLPLLSALYGLISPFV